MPLLETTFLVDLLRGKAGAAELLDELEGRGEPLFVSSPTVMELWKGVLECGIQSRERTKVDEILSAIPILPFESPDAKRTAEILFELSGRGTPIEVQDAMIAGMAISRGETVVTRDAHFARIPGLRMLKY